MREVSEYRIAKEIQSKIEEELSRVGLLARVFSRAKSEESITAKFNRSKDKYSSSGKKIQDLIGVRVALYFSDDNDIAQQAIKNIFLYDEDSSTIDQPEKNSFAASRCNLIFKLSDDHANESQILKMHDYIDSTFEVQIRTILSEGWHEVEHDLRYKCKSDWDNHDDLSRALNGIYASLETSEWSMLKLFEELAYRHYKKKEWPQMIRSKFRLRTGNDLSLDIEELFNNDSLLGKRLLRVDRSDFIVKLLEDEIELPVSLNNIVFLCNHYYIKSDDITNITPEPISDICNNLTDGSACI